MENYMLFQKSITPIKELEDPNNPDKEINPYKTVYPETYRLKMWTVFGDLFIHLGCDKLYLIMEEMLNDNFNLASKQAEVYRQLFLSMFRLEKFDSLVQIITFSGDLWKLMKVSMFRLEKFDSLVQIITFSGDLWKLMKVLFVETIKPENEWSEKAREIFDTVLGNKQYFINPLESLVYNKDEELAQKVMEFAIEHDCMHKLVSAKKNGSSSNILHCDYIIRTYATDDATKELWKTLNERQFNKLKEEKGEENEHIQQVLKNLEKPPRSDKDMAKPSDFQAK
eukprot:CAMPEP_0197018542 /NCGR_PEP_ID=MMETSP1380-20130617/80161_1 /TAXON_ID=5936 /ORGANISM="Euplotes crassus, Strain CT5" /LENGTH=281 /DNA_ID=CAMNT_0042445775 /DNA_START=134 /DNA_END=977 /DNA_ORIENTATION=-